MLALSRDVYVDPDGSSSESSHSRMSEELLIHGVYTHTTSLNTHYLRALIIRAMSAVHRLSVVNVANHITSEIKLQNTIKQACNYRSLCADTLNTQKSRDLHRLLWPILSFSDNWKRTRSETILCLKCFRASRLSTVLLRPPNTSRRKLSIFLMNLLPTSRRPSGVLSKVYNWFGLRLRTKKMIRTFRPLKPRTSQFLCESKLRNSASISYLSPFLRRPRFKTEQRVLNLKQNSRAPMIGRCLA